jgi:hypothetical protein
MLMTFFVNKNGEIECVYDVNAACPRPAHVVMDVTMRGQDVGIQDLESRDTAHGEIGVAVDGLSRKPSDKICRIGRPDPKSKQGLPINKDVPS